ncbi:hypothetical protein VPH35_114256 [Triticum aestivum]
MAFAGVSLIADGRLCASTESVFDSGADSGYHLLVSRPFIIGGRRWKVDYHPNGFDTSDQEFISVFLVHDEYLKHYVQAHVAFSFIGQPELRVPNLIRQKHPCCFYYDCSLSDQPARLVTREAFERSSHLKNDSFVLRCDVVVLDKKDDESGEEEEEEPARPFIKLPPSDLPSHFSDLLLSKEGADITFEVGGKKLTAHRCVLAARSTVFKTQLFVAMNEDAAAPSVVKIDGIEANVFTGLLNFVYTNGMPDFEDAMPISLLKRARKYAVTMGNLEISTGNQNLGKRTVAGIIVVAERRRRRWLKDACLEFIKTHTSLHTVFTADGLEQIIRAGRPSVLQELISTFASQKRCRFVVLVYTIRRMSNCQSTSRKGGFCPGW